MPRLLLPIHSETLDLANWSITNHSNRFKSTATTIINFRSIVLAFLFFPSPEACATNLLLFHPISKQCNDLIYFDAFFKGNLDSETIRMMGQPRCGNKDRTLGDDARRKKRYALQGKWLIDHKSSKAAKSWLVCNFSNGWMKTVRPNAVFFLCSTNGCIRYLII